MKKKLLVFMFRLAGGGAERTMLNIVNNINKKKFDVVLVLGTKSGNEYIDFINNEVRIVNLECKRLRSSIFSLKKTIDKEKPDIMFSTLNNNNIVLLALKAICYKHIPTYVRETNNRTQSGSVSLINKTITIFLYNKYANKVISLSKGVKEDLIDNFKIKRNKIEVIYNPIETDEIIEYSKEKINDLLLRPNEKVIIASGRLVEQKDYFTLLKAFSIVSKKIKAKLIILGKGPLKTELIQLSRDLKIDDKVLFLGFKKNPYKYLKVADIFVLSSKWEGFGHVIVEAMVVGTPVIATNCKSGPDEIIGNDKYGILVPVQNHKILADRIIYLLNNQKKISEYSALGRIRSKEFDVKKIILQYEKVFLSS